MSLQIVLNNIVDMDVDAIVDPTDEYYSGGGGADRAIHEAAGLMLDQACSRLEPCTVGSAVITPGFELTARWVIHTVGPRWRGGKYREQEYLCSCYRKSLELAAQKGLESIAFPLLASGSFGYPKEAAVTAAMSTIRNFLNDHEMIVYLVVYDREALSVSDTLYGDVRRMLRQKNVQPAFKSGNERVTGRMGQVPPNRRVEAEEFATDSVAGFGPQESGMDASFLCSSADYSCDVEEAVGSAPQEGKKTDSNRNRLWTPIGEPPIRITSLEEMLSRKDTSFIDALTHMIDARGMTDAQCYKKANVDKRLFNKIKNKPKYAPQKSTVIALAFALEPTWDELIDLVTRAGYSLTYNNEFDLIIRYCFERRKFDIFEVNDLLFHFGQPLLGSFPKESA